MTTKTLTGLREGHDFSRAGNVSTACGSGRAALGGQAQSRDSLTNSEVSLRRAHVTIGPMLERIGPTRPLRQAVLICAILLALAMPVCLHGQAGPTAEVTKTGRIITPPPDVAAPPPDAQITASGLGMKVITPGTGTEHPLQNDCVTVSFIAWKTDGTLFSTSTTMNDADVLCLNASIMGISQALKEMVVGEKRRLWIPEDLTFHEGHHHVQRRPEDEEPPHKDLTFDLKLLSILKAPPTPPDLVQPPAEAVRTPSGLAYEFLKHGTGKVHPSMSSKVTLHFSGWRSDGRLFETTVMTNQPALVTLGTASAAWREGLPKMVVGDKARLWIPSALAYTDKPANRFNPPGNLVYDIELLKIE